MRRPTRQHGFTILELMISVAIVGLLAAIAIPNFLNYQAHSRRTEAYGSMGAIERAQKSFYAERDSYHGTALPFPDPALHNASGVLDTSKMPWDAAASAAYAELGWAPEGEVFYTYEINTGCGCNACFTASAFGDVDADGVVSAVMFVEPDPSGVGITECPSIMAPGGSPFGTPTRLGTGQPIYREVAVNRSADEY